MYVVVFDKSGKGLSGWHYGKLRRFGTEWIQQSVVKLENMTDAVEFAKTLHKFGVQNIRIFKALNVSSKL